MYKHLCIDPKSEFRDARSKSQYVCWDSSWSLIPSRSRDPKPQIPVPMVCFPGAVLYLWSLSIWLTISILAISFSFKLNSSLNSFTYFFKLFARRFVSSANTDVFLKGEFALRPITSFWYCSRIPGSLPSLSKLSCSVLKIACLNQGTQSS